MPYSDDEEDPVGPASDHSQQTPPDQLTDGDLPAAIFESGAVSADDRCAGNNRIEASGAVLNLRVTALAISSTDCAGLRSERGMIAASAMTNLQRCRRQAASCRPLGTSRISRETLRPRCSSQVGTCCLAYSSSPAGSASTSHRAQMSQKSFMISEQRRMCPCSAL